jgi:hypothetical protein
MPWVHDQIVIKIFVSLLESHPAYFRHMRVTEMLIPEHMLNTQESGIAK